MKYVIMKYDFKIMVNKSVLKMSKRNAIINSNLIVNYSSYYSTLSNIVTIVNASV